MGVKGKLNLTEASLREGSRRTGRREGGGPATTKKLKVSFRGSLLAAKGNWSLVRGKNNVS